MSTCPKCGKECNGPVGLAAHMRSHDTRTVDCPIAGCDATPRHGAGLGRHLTVAHGITSAERRGKDQAKVFNLRAEAERRRRTLHGLFGRIVPELADHYLKRLLDLTLTHAPVKKAFAIIGADYGPVMVREAMVGEVCARAGQPCVVIDLTLVVEAQEAAAVNERYRS